MLFACLKYPARLALYFYCKRVSIDKPAMLRMNGPLLIACNHPNSFLDAIILATLFKKPVISLARGDAFKNKFIFKLLRALNILPVYRLSEGAENLHTNYKTFDQCRTIFRNNGIVLIFSEGLCINEWKLRTLKKGTARLAISSWNEGIPLTVLPVGINYHSFTRYGKHVHIRFGTPIIASDFTLEDTTGNNIQQFNKKLHQALHPLVMHVEQGDSRQLRHLFGIKKNNLAVKHSLALPALFGNLLHIPLYLPTRWFAKKFFARNGHYDSFLIGSLFIFYPIYVIGITVLLFQLWKSAGVLLVIPAMPLFALSYLYWREDE